MRLLGLLPVAVGRARRWRCAHSGPAGHGRRPASGVSATTVCRCSCASAPAIIVRQLFAEASGFDGDPQTSVATVQLLHARRLRRRDAQGGKEWRLLATRSATRIDWAELTRGLRRGGHRGFRPAAAARLHAALAQARPLGAEAHRRGRDLSWPAAAGRYRRRSRWPRIRGRRRKPLRPRSTPRARFPPGSMK